MFKLLAASALLFLLVSSSTSHHVFVWNVLDTSLPKPLSDMTATLGGSLVYIAGGCDSEQGNEFIEFQDAEGLNQTGFACFSISDKLYQFDPSSQEISSLPDLPRPRYRHGAAIANNFLWLFGGRDVEENLIAEVDVFDIDAGVWLDSPGSLDESLQTSDNAGFSFASKVYSVGGFTVDYEAKTTVFTMEGDSTSSLVTNEVASLLEARGDVAAAVLNENTAFVSGGFTHENDFCNPLASVERFSSGTWMEAPPQVTARADKALVVLNNQLYAVGGETQIPNKCIINPNDLPEAGEQTLAVDDVEVLKEGQGAWKVLASLPNHRFRFAAIGWDDTNTIYSFGGQVAYDSECKCFKTSNEIVTYKEEEHGEDGNDGNTSGAIINDNDKSVITMAVAMWGMMLMMFH